MFDVKDLGSAKLILGMEILRDRKAVNYGCHRKDILNGCWKCSI